MHRYLKTTVFGLTGNAPHYAMLMIGSNAGIIGMTKGADELAAASFVPSANCQCAMPHFHQAFAPH